MGTLATVQSWQVKTSTGVWPATMSIMHNGSEIPLAEGQVIAPDTPGGEPPAPATWVKPLIGAGGGPEAEQYTPLNGVVGSMLARRSYDGNLPSSFAASLAASDVAAGRHSYWSWKPHPTQFATSPSQQAAFSNFLDTIPAGHKVTIFAQHEPENNMSDYGGNYGGLEGWGALQQAAATIVRSKGRSELRFGPCFMGPWTWDSRSPYYTWINQWGQVMDWSLFDVIGIDPYATIHPGGFSLQQMLTVRNSGSGSGNSSVKSMMAWLAEWDIPIVVAEWGYYRKQAQDHGVYALPVDPIPDAVVASWIRDAYEWAKTWNTTHLPRLENGRVKGAFIDAMSWFNYSLLGTDCPLTGPLAAPTTVGLKIDAYRDIVIDSKIPPT